MGKILVVDFFPLFLLENFLEDEIFCVLPFGSERMTCGEPCGLSRCLPLDFLVTVDLTFPCVLVTVWLTGISRSFPFTLRVLGIFFLFLAGVRKMTAVPFF